MSNAVMINVRMDAALKEQAGLVFERCGVSPSQAMKSFYKFVVKEQKMPDFVVAENDKVDRETEKKRNAARKLVELGLSIPDRDVQDKTDKELWHEHLIEKYG